MYYCTQLLQKFKEWDIFSKWYRFFLNTKELAKSKPKQTRADKRQKNSTLAYPLVPRLRYALEIGGARMCTSDKHSEVKCIFLKSHNQVCAKIKTPTCKKSQSRQVN